MFKAGALLPYVAVSAGLLWLHNAWAAIGLYHLGIIAFLIFSPDPFRKYNLQLPQFKTTVFSALFGMTGGLALYLLLPVLGIRSDIGHYFAAIGLTSMAWPWFIAYYVIVNPILEEFFWRGWLGSDARRPVLNDFLFAGYHVIVLAGNVSLFWLPVVFVVLTFASWYWRRVDNNSGTLAPSVISHTAGDLAVIIAIYAAVALPASVPVF